MDERTRDKQRAAELNAIPKGPAPCDAGCGQPATEWFGETSCATCGSGRCVGIMQRDRARILRGEE